MGVLSFGMNLKEAVSAPRLQHQLIPNELWFESTVSESLIQGLRDRNHNVVQCRYKSIVQAIYIDDNSNIHSSPDYRVEGVPDGY